MANPLGGPVFVAGAERGDTLVVHIEDILVADYSLEMGVSRTRSAPNCS